MVLGMSTATFTLLHVLISLIAPNGAEPPFVITQLLVLIGFIALGVAAAKRFHPDAMLMPAHA